MIFLNFEAETRGYPELGTGNWLYWIVCGSDAQNDNAFDTQILNETWSMCKTLFVKSWCNIGKELYITGSDDGPFEFLKGEV